MSLGQIVAGQKYKWDLLAKLGEGDAGEVYLVEVLLKGRQAILKRPSKSAFISDTLRQASQIQSEAGLLRALEKLSFPLEGAQISIPGLIDQSTVEEGYGEGYFIVMEKAAGFDLKTLAQVTHFGLLERLRSADKSPYGDFLQRLAKLPQLPDQLLIRSLLAVLNLLETVHTAEVWDGNEKHAGLIWNDIKPDHLFWDPQKACLTVIDWGNGAFLEADGSTPDRQFSRIGDDYQFIQAMGEFLAEANPMLLARLEWPKTINPANAYTEGVRPLKQRLSALNEELMDQLQQLRETASQLYDVSRPGLSDLSKSDELQQQMVAFGDLPDSSRALNFYGRVALQLASDHELEAFQKICLRASELAASSSEKWSLLKDLAGLQYRDDIALSDRVREALPGALASGIVDEWASLLWELFEAVGNDPVPAWWPDISRRARQVQLDLDPDGLPPSGAINRLYYTLQAIVLERGDKNAGPAPGDEASGEAERINLDNMLKIFDSEVVKKWKDREPAPPNSGIGYREFDTVMDDLEAVIPDARQAIQSAINQPSAQAEIALNAWEHRDFETARKALRRILLWDPDRWRLLAADRAIAQASQWLTVVRNGARKDEPFYDYLASTELAGRRLRNRVGPANWLDNILDTLRRLRKGARSADLIMEHPEIAEEIPWLNEFKSREVLTLPHSRPLTLERDQVALTNPVTVMGSQEGRLGAGQEVSLGDPLDTWVPEARGSSARVFAGSLRDRTGKDQSFAIKVMRPDRLEYALPLFREEAHILSLLRDVPGVTPLIECGFLRLDDDAQLPAEDRHLSATHLSGQVVRYGAEQVQNYLSSMDRYLGQGWVPYLALERREQDQNLLKYCDAGITHGWFLPLRQSLLISIQICDILQNAHDRNIVYRDHKILHYYWDPATHGVISIDWNIAKRHAEGLSEPERIFDLVQFGARALHHILTGRPAPGALPLGPNRPDEIEQASTNYEVNWTYDDERLPNRVKEILEQVLNQGYGQVRDLRADLAALYDQISGTAS